jgi:hypothetical protein
MKNLESIIDSYLNPPEPPNGYECHFCGDIFSEDDIIEIPYTYGHMKTVLSCAPCAIEQRNYEIEHDGESKIPEIEEDN